MIKFYCIGCKYRFEAEKMPLNCPYCAKKGAIRQEESASDLLEEVNKLLENEKSK